MGPQLRRGVRENDPSIKSQYIFPCGIAIDDGGNILVGDKMQHGIRHLEVCH